MNPFQEYHFHLYRRPCTSFQGSYSLYLPLSPFYLFYYPDSQERPVRNLPILSIHLPFSSLPSLSIFLSTLLAFFCFFISYFFLPRIVSSSAFVSFIFRLILLCFSLSFLGLTSFSSSSSSFSYSPSFHVNFLILVLMFDLLAVGTSPILFLHLLPLVIDPSFSLSPPAPFLSFLHPVSILHLRPSPFLHFLFLSVFFCLYHFSLFITLSHLLDLPFSSPPPSLPHLHRP